METTAARVATPPGGKLRKQPPQLAIRRPRHGGDPTETQPMGRKYARVRL